MSRRDLGGQRGLLALGLLLLASVVISCVPPELRPTATPPASTPASPKSGPQATAPAAGGVTTFPLPIQIFTDFGTPDDRFDPSGFMPASAAQLKALSVNPQYSEDCQAGRTCLEITYTRQAGDEGWAGVYFLRPIRQSGEANWGREPGIRVDGPAARVSLYLRGKAGGEEVQLKAGCVKNEQLAFKDSFCTPAQRVTASTKWQQFSIPLAGQDLSMVLGPLAVVLDRPATIYLDDIKLEAASAASAAPATLPVAATSTSAPPVTATPPATATPPLAQSPTSPPAPTAVPPTTLPPQRSAPGPTRVNVGDYYAPAGYMGDISGIMITTDDQVRRPQHLTSLKVTVRPGSQGWAGAYWLLVSDRFPQGNWGDAPGLNLSGARRLTWWARGVRGGEKVQFLSGGIRAAGKPHQDSYERKPGIVTLSTDWQEFSIDLTGVNLSSVLGPFAFVAARASNPAEVTFFLSDIVIEGIAEPKPAAQSGDAAGPDAGLTWGPPGDPARFAANLAALRAAFAERCFAAYASPTSDPWHGVEPTDAAIEADLEVLAGRDAPGARSIRGLVTYGATSTARRLAELARARDLVLIQGIWNPLDQAEIERAIAACAASQCVGFGMGNEGILRGEYAIAELAGAMADLRRRTNLPVASSEPLDSYYSPVLRTLSDWHFPIAHPLSHGLVEPVAAVAWTVAAYEAALREAGSKPVMFKEVGLPSRSEHNDADFSEARQAEYYRRISGSTISYTVFELFDFPAKERAAGTALEGAWGLFYADRTPKAVAAGAFCPARR